MLRRVVSSFGKTTRSTLSPFVVSSCMMSSRNPHEDIKLNPKFGVATSPDFPFTSPDQFDRENFIWPEETKRLFTSFVEQGYTPKLFNPDPNNYTSGGVSPERRIMYQFFFRPGPAFGSEHSHPTVHLHPKYPSKMMGTFLML